jgi:hypothetical protein
MAVLLTLLFRIKPKHYATSVSTFGMKNALRILKIRIQSPVPLWAKVKPNSAMIHCFYCLLIGIQNDEH